MATPIAAPACATSRRMHSASSRSSCSSASGHGALGEVVDPLPAAALRAHHLAGVQQPLHGDLRLGPVPPRAAVLGAAELGGGQRPLGRELVEHGRAGALGVRQHVPAVTARPPGPAPEGEVRPLLDRQDAGGVRPVLEGVVVRPVRLLDRGRGRPRRAGRTGSARASGPAPRSCRAARRPATAARRGRPPAGPGRPGTPGPAAPIRRASSADSVSWGGGRTVMPAQRRTAH